MKHYVKVLLVALLSLFLIVLNIYKVEAHDTNLGAVGYEGLTYDPCIPYSTELTGAGNSDGEVWYGLEYNLQGERVMQHIDDDIETIYYKIHDTNPNDLEANWSEDPLAYKAYIEVGISAWNAISIYKINEDGHLYKTKLVNFVNMDDLSDTTNITPNIDIYPGSGGVTVAGGCDIIEESEVMGDRTFFNETRHSHYTRYKITLYPAVIGRNFDGLFATVSHELGHILGLGDLDEMEYELFESYHHQEILMGYANSSGMQHNVTYCDLAGVMITRGLHTNDDHIWIYDESSSSDGNHKLICSLCNVVKYVSDLTNYEYEEFLKCQENFSYADSHKLENGNMIPVASYNRKDYFKCKYCRYTCWFCDLTNQTYEYAGIFNENTHILENHVNGLEYTLEEEHNFSISLDDGRMKCKGCPMCSNGSIYDGDLTQLNLDCVMNDINNQISIDVAKSKMYKLEVVCKNSYTIFATSNTGIVLELYDSNFQKINNLVYSNNSNNTKEISKLLEKGTYYVKVRFIDHSISGNINFSISSDDDCYDIPIYDGDLVDIQEHQHQGYSEYKYYNEKIGFHKITLNSSLNIYPLSSITIKDSNGNVIQKYINNLANPLAITNNGQNIMYVLLSEVDYYLFEVDYYTTVDQEITMKIDYIDDDAYIPYNVFTDNGLEICNNSSSLNDTIYKFRTKQNSQYKFDVSFDGDASSNNQIMFFVIRKYNTVNLEPVYQIVNRKLISANESYSINLDLPNYYTYYVGYFGNIIGGNVDINLINYQEEYSGTIVTDPDSATNCGTEVKLYGGTYRGNVIHQGFTRICYLTETNHSSSRLDYEWYVSNPLVAEVTDYGTVRAFDVQETTTVKVIAVYNNEMSHVIEKTFIISPDNTGSTITYEYNITLSINETCLIESYNTWPSLIRQHYNWSSDNEEILTVSSWGKLTPKSLGTVSIYGEYIYNTRYHIYIQVNIV